MLVKAEKKSKGKKFAREARDKFYLALHNRFPQFALSDMFTVTIEDEENKTEEQLKKKKKKKMEEKDGKKEKEEKVDQKTTDTIKCMPTAFEKALKSIEAVYKVFS